MSGPPAYLDRMEAAHREVGHTSVARGTAWTLAAGFLIAIAGVPLTQTVLDISGGTPGIPGWTLAAVDDGGSVAEAEVVLVRAAHRVVRENRRLLRAFQDVENTLADESAISRLLRPFVQSVLTGWLGVGNEEVYLGRSGWLFYRPGLDYLIGPGFLDRRQLERRVTEAAEWARVPQPDPRAAILDFKTQLERHGIALIVVPTPTKATIHPEQFARRAGEIALPLQNASYADFVEALHDNGVLVFDPAPFLAAERRRTGTPQFLVTDTHWRPEAMRVVAEGLRAFIAEHVPLPALPPAGYREHDVTITSQGDLTRMLDLPLTQRVYPAEIVSIRQVRTSDGRLWYPSARADIVLLGDSFTNIYSLGALGWGEGAGFAEQLSLVMQRPLDRLARNDAGAYSTRDTLARELARGRDRLAHTRLVIYQFAARELTEGDWRVIELGASGPAPAGPVPRPAEGWRVVRGVVRAIGAVPRPGAVPYRDHIVAVHVAALEPSADVAAAADLLVYVRSLRDGDRMPGARLTPGEILTLRLRPWAEVSNALEGISRSELPDDRLLLAEPWWGEVLER